MLDPDTKDWTWVLERPCPACGFDASCCEPATIAGLVRDNADTWKELLAAKLIGAGRPDEGTWSSLEYACHVRDVYLRYDARLVLMLTSEDPLFPNWDQDATAVEERYEEQAPEIVVDDLRTAALAIAARLDGLAEQQWRRPGRRSDGASFTIASICRYMVHDPIHHVWDVMQAAAD